MTKTVTAPKNGSGTAERIGSVTNDAERLIALQEPYAVEFTIEGVAPILFHAWSDDAVAEKAAAKKGSAAKKTDDVESYVYRDESGWISMPGMYVYSAITKPGQGAAKYRQDPRSPRKSALDLFRAGIAPLTILTPIKNARGKRTKTWDLLDRRRAVVNQAGITRSRPCFLEGWQASFVFQVNLPEYIAPADVLEVLSLAGRVCGVGDFRPTFGRFQVVSFREAR